MSGLAAAAYRIVARSGLAAAARALRPAATVFCYHNVVADPQENRLGDGPLHLGVTRLRDQLDWIESAFEVVPLADIVERVGRGSAVRGLAALTFDDAYQGVVSLALPELRSRRLPATVFVVSEASRRPAPFWWDRLGMEGRLDADTRLRCLGPLGGSEAAIAEEYPPREGLPCPEMLLPATLDVLRAALGNGIEAGSHTLTHPNLTALSPSSLDHELAGSRAALADSFGEPPRLVSYPYGLTSAAVRSAAERAGYDAGIALSFGRVLPGSDRFNLIRINVPATLPVDALACWASGLRWRPPR
jgi:peptidoglycan/xylan/chitin deacetylase (PgdA/CDA1 family)